MKIKKLHIERYEGIENVDVYFNYDVSFLISDNNVGKTRVLECLEAFYGKNKNECEASIDIELNDEDIIDINDKEIVDILNTHCIEDPSDEIARKEYFKYINKTINDNLSEHERNVLKYYQQNKTYEEIAKKLNCKTKSVDTAMTRIRRKANKIKKEVQDEE